MREQASRIVVGALRWLLRRLSPNWANFVLILATENRQWKGPDFVTVRHRRKVASEAFVQWPEVGSGAKVGIVIQGPVLEQNDFTYQTVCHYRRECPEVAVILSTWVDAPAADIEKYRLAGAYIVLSDKPQVAGRFNVNFQVKSTLAGIDFAARLGCDFVAKCRTDQRVYSISMLWGLLALLQAFPLRGQGRQTQRLIAISNITGRYVPFFLSDFFMFGTLHDMTDYWSVPQDACALTREELDSIQTRGATSREVAGYSPEQFLCMTYLAKVGAAPEYTIAEWWRQLADRFVIIDWASLDLYWPKYNSTFEEKPWEVTDGSTIIRVPVSFGDWLQLWNADRDNRNAPEHVLSVNPHVTTVAQLKKMLSDRMTGGSPPSGWVASNSTQDTALASQ